MNQSPINILSHEWGWDNIRRDVFQLVAWGYRRKEKEIRQPHKILFIEEFIWAAFLPHHRSVSYGASVNLTRLREITEDLAELFGLAIPVSPQKTAGRR